MSLDRSLRIFTLFTTALATPLLIGCTVASLQDVYGRFNYYRPHRAVTTFCFGYIPLALTAAASVVGIARHDNKPRVILSLLDLAAAVLYVAILIPIWAVEVSLMNQGGLGLLIGYTTAPMIVNAIFHIYSFVLNAKYACTRLFSRSEHECPNCHSKFLARAPQIQEASKGGEHYSLLRGEDYLDEDAVAYADRRTSEEQVGPEGAGDLEANKGKGAIKI